MYIYICKYLLMEKLYYYLLGEYNMCYIAFIIFSKLISPFWAVIAWSVSCKCFCPLRGLLLVGLPALLLYGDFASFTNSANE